MKEHTTKDTYSQEEIDQMDGLEAFLRGQVLGLQKLRDAHKQRIKLLEIDVEYLRGELDRAGRRIKDLLRSRTALDCRFAGNYAELSGSHCPLDDPCARCEYEREIDQLREDIGIRDAALRDAGLAPKEAPK